MINWLLILVLAVLIELATICTRFVFKISSKDTYMKIMKKFDLHFFIHMHHGIIGILVVLVALTYDMPWTLGLGSAMILSDAIHHFVVLAIVIGNPEFHIIYKDIADFKKEQILEDRKLKKFVRHIVHIIN